MEPLVCVVPQSLRVLIDRLPAYISFLEQQGYSVYRQCSTRLTALQARTLYARTQDELFSLHTPVAVLLLERRAAVRGLAGGEGAARHCVRQPGQEDGHGRHLPVLR